MTAASAGDDAASIDALCGNDTNDTYVKAKSAVENKNYREALQLFQSLLRSESSSLEIRILLTKEIRPLLEKCYGPRGSDGRICLWYDAPLLSPTEPPCHQGCAYVQVGRKLYRHGGHDFVGGELGPSVEQLWELDIDGRKWKRLETASNSPNDSPGPRSSHVMFHYRGDLYVWGGMDRNCRMNKVNTFDSKLYRLKNVGRSARKGGRRWEMVKTNAKRPPGREEHAGVLYKGKYYIMGGNLSSKQPTNDLWQLNLSNCKWKPLKSGPRERHHHQMWAANDKLYVLGGRTKVRKREVNGAPDMINPSIEEFVAFDIMSKTWDAVDVFGNDRPYNVSEFTALPIYSDGNADDPTSVIVWGGYVEHDTWSDEFKSCPSPEEWAQSQYGDDWEDFSLPYISRLVRFDVATNVWKNLKPTTDILPKAMSFAACDRVENGVLHLLVGGGYGYNPSCLDHKTEKQLEKIALVKEFAAKGLCQMPEEGGTYPLGSNKIYKIAITESFGNAYDGEQTKWCWDMYNYPEEKRPTLMVEGSPWSTTLYNVSDITDEDFALPPCTDVLPNDDETLLGVRVRLLGLQGRKDLNGLVGRCGTWQQTDGRYQVFVCDKLSGSTKSLSVKPSNLEVVREPITSDEVMVRVVGERKFPRIAMHVCAEVDDNQKLRQPLLETFLKPLKHGTGSCGQIKTSLFHDSYHGPLSRKAQAILRTVATSDDPDSGVLRFVFVPKTLIKAGADASKFELYSNFVQQLATEDTRRVKEFESNIASIEETAVDSVCGKWLKISAQIDGLRPITSREFLVCPEVTMRALHEMILCPAFGWMPSYHSYAFRMLKCQEINSAHSIDLNEECWIGPKKSTSLDQMFMPLYIGGALADSRKITLGQLFVHGRRSEADAVNLQYVHDFGDWYSHSICVSKCNEDDNGDVPSEAGTVAHLIRGENGSLVDDIGGVLGWIRQINQLIGRIEPTDEKWWTVLNENIRQRSNRLPLLSNPLEFNLDAVRDDIAEAMRKPLAKSGRENRNLTTHDPALGLRREFNSKVVAPLPKNRTKLCAVCGVTIALKLCSRCSEVAYCSREHQLEHWKHHKAECKKKRGA